MEIVYLGHSSFRLKGKSSTVVTDPYDEKSGKFPRDIDANIVTVSHDHGDHNAVNKVGGNPFIITGPGEYEVGGVSVIGVPTFHDDKEGGERGGNTVYVVEIDGLRIVHMGDLGHKLTQEQLDEIGPVGIALVPVGGTYTIDAKIASEVVKQLEASVVIPMHYQQPGMDAGTFGSLTGVEDFLKEMSKTDVAPIPKYVITGEKLPTELQVVVLEKK